MEKLSWIIGLILLTMLAISLVGNIWPYVIGLLALVGLAQVYWVWIYRVHGTR
jgi:hypothetical protein